MSTHQNKHIPHAIASLAVLLLSGCPLLSFENLDVTVWPKDRDTVIAAGESPWVEFPESPDRASVQRLFPFHPRKARLREISDGMVGAFTLTLLLRSAPACDTC